MGQNMRIRYQSLIELISDFVTSIRVFPLCLYQSLIELISDIKILNF